MATISTVTQKGQATIPANIRRRLHLQSGDKILFIENEDKIYIQKSPPLERDYLKALENTLEEWNSDADNQAYNDL